MLGLGALLPALVGAVPVLLEEAPSVLPRAVGSFFLLFYPLPLPWLPLIPLVFGGGSLLFHSLGLLLRPLCGFRPLCHGSVGSEGGGPTQSNKMLHKKYVHLPIDTEARTVTDKTQSSYETTNQAHGHKTQDCRNVFVARAPKNI